MRRDANGNPERTVRARLIKTFLAGLMMSLAWLPSGQAGGLPEPLSDFDAALYQRLFHLQEVGRMKQATREMFRLESDLLRGHLLSQRYLHPTAWRSSYRELSSWLKTYNDHPDASRIFWLARKRRPKNAAAPTEPKPGYLNGYGLVGVNSYRPLIPMYTGGRASPPDRLSLVQDIPYSPLVTRLLSHINI